MRSNSLSSDPCLRVWTAGCTHPGLRLRKAQDRAGGGGQSSAAGTRRAATGSPGWLEPPAPLLNSGRNAIYRPPDAPASAQILKVAPPPPPEPNIREKTPRPFPRILIQPGPATDSIRTFVYPPTFPPFHSSFVKGKEVGARDQGGGLGR